MAEAFGKSWVREMSSQHPGIADVQIWSRGLTDDYEPPGSPASEHGVSILRDDYGIDNSQHVSKLITEEDVMAASYIIGVTVSHAQVIKQAFPAAASKVFVLSKNVADPWHSSLDVYRACATSMKPLVYEALTALLL